MKSARKSDRVISRCVVIGRNGVSRALRPTIPPPFAPTAVLAPYTSSYFTNVPRFQSYTSVSFIITEFRGISPRLCRPSTYLCLSFLLAFSFLLLSLFSFALTTRRITSNRLSLSSFVSRLPPPHPRCRHKLERPPLYSVEKKKILTCSRLAKLSLPLSISFAH